MAPTPKRESGAGAIRVIVNTISCRSVRSVVPGRGVRAGPGCAFAQCICRRRDFGESCNKSFSATQGFFANYFTGVAESATANLACFKRIAITPRRRNAGLRSRSRSLPGRDSNLAMAGLVKCGLRLIFLSGLLAAAAILRAARRMRVVRRHRARERWMLQQANWVFLEHWAARGSVRI